ncbi:MAG: CehA/McbA family metallohydrolase [Deltaproteobacteria bacterium]|nr:CehA/McbA family metallohydrolase [Deltaproteobacteria bacterium]
MPRRLFTALALVFALALVPTLAIAVPPDYQFTGQVDRDDIGSYLYLDFDVPGGTTRIDFTYNYTEVATGKSKAIFNPVIDIGVFDPDGFRGWSGSNKKSFSVGKSKAATSDSYIPGALQTGTWQVELGIGYVPDDSALAYTVTVNFYDGDVGDAFEPEEYSPVVLNDAAGWYKGDLHCHSTHSDGSQTMAVTMQYAHTQGLDFIALTDHNAISHMLYIPEFQDSYPDMLLINGVELTTYAGHYNIFGIRGYMPYQGTDIHYDINEVFDAVHSDGGYVSINHPVAPGLRDTPREGFSYGIGWGIPDTDWGKVDFLEVINGSVNPSGINFYGNLLNINLWDDLQDMDYALPARGGSDDHRSGTGTGDTYAPIGVPTTVVYADELSEHAVMEALKAGRAYVKMIGPDGPDLFINATAGDAEAMMGETIRGDKITITARVVGGNGYALRILQDGAKIDEYDKIPVDSDDFETSFTIDVGPETDTRYRAELYDGVMPIALTNSLYVRPPLPGDDDDDDDDDTGDDDAADDDIADDDAPDDDTTDDDASDDDGDDDASDDDDDDDSGCGC